MRDVLIDYTNWRGERSVRRVLPVSVFFGTTQYHRDKQWFLTAVDVEKNAERHFAMSDIHSWRSVDGDTSASQ